MHPRKDKILKVVKEFIPLVPKQRGKLLRSFFHSPPTPSLASLVIVHLENWCLSDLLVEEKSGGGGRVIKMRKENVPLQFSDFPRNRSPPPQPHSFPPSPSLPSLFSPTSQEWTRWWWWWWLHTRTCLLGFRF